MHNEVFSGKYHVQREIARGGMGTVYLAVDQTLNREVAIKLPHSQLSSDPKFAQKFLKEAQRMAQMNHENVIRIYEIEEDKGVHFIVMEYFPGQDLKQLLRDRGSLELSLALRIAISIAHGLVYAHQRDLIHRDIKPGNVLLDDQYNVKIVDFGIAAALGESSTTMTSTLLGTPEYMSPEQVQGAKLTTSSDLYSLGMVLYEMVTGATPYKGIPYQTILVKLADGSFEPEYHFPSHVPLSLQFLVRGLTKKNPYDRLRDTTVVLETLRGYQQQPDFLSVPGREIDFDVTQSSKTVMVDAPLPARQNVPGDKTRAIEADTKSISLSDQRSPSPSSHSPIGGRPLSAGITKTENGSSDILEASGEDSSTIRLDDEHQPLAASSWLLLSFALILIVGVSGYLWFRTSLEVLPTLPPVVEDSSTDSEPLVPESNASIENAKEVIEQMVSLQRRTQAFEGKIASHGRKFETAAEQLVDKLRLLGQRLPISGRQSQVSDHARSQEIISQNWRVLAMERESESRQLSETSQVLASEIHNMSNVVNSALSGSLSPGMKDSLDRKRNELLVLHRNVLSHISRVVEKWQQHVLRMDSVFASQKAEPLSVQPSSPTELDGILDQFREAYQRQDLGLLKDMTAMSDSRVRMVRGLFRYWDSFTVKVGVRLNTPESATVVVTLEEMIDHQGNPISQEREKIIGTQRLTIHKQGSTWGKLTW